MRVRKLGITICVGIALALSGCGDDPPAKSAQSDAKAKTKDAKDKGAGAEAETKKKSRKAAKEEEPVEELPPPLAFPIDFNESARTRDPFFSYAREFAEEAKKRVRSQREVVLDQYALDELKLAGLVTGIRPARAMLIDPTKKGHVIHEGQFVGRSEVVQGGATGADYEINWRVDRIRDGDIVLVREDPANPDVPSATRVIPLRPDDVLAAR
jgi:type IV pilus assembly protein PilP